MKKLIVLLLLVVPMAGFTQNDGGMDALYKEFSNRKGVICMTIPVEVLSQTVEEIIEDIEEQEGIESNDDTDALNIPGLFVEQIMVIIGLKSESLSDSDAKELWLKAQKIGKSKDYKLWVETSAPEASLKIFSNNYRGFKRAKTITLKGYEEMQAPEGYFLLNQTINEKTGKYTQQYAKIESDLKNPLIIINGYGVSMVLKLEGLISADFMRRLPSMGIIEKMKKIMPAGSLQPTDEEDSN